MDSIQSFPNRLGATDDPGLDLEPVPIQLGTQRHLDLVRIGRSRYRFVQVEESGDPSKLFRILLGHDGQQRWPRDCPREHAGQLRRYGLVEPAGQHEDHLLRAGAQARLDIPRGLHHLYVVTVRLRGIPDGDSALEIMHFDEDSGQREFSRSVVTGETAADQVHGMVDEDREDLEAVRDTARAPRQVHDERGATNSRHPSPEGRPRGLPQTLQAYHLRNPGRGALEHGPSRFRGHVPGRKSGPSRREKKVTGTFVAQTHQRSRDRTGLVRNPGAFGQSVTLLTDPVLDQSTGRIFPDPGGDSVGHGKHRDAQRPLLAHRFRDPPS